MCFHIDHDVFFASVMYKSGYYRHDGWVDMPQVNWDGVKDLMSFFPSYLGAYAVSFR